MRFFWLALLALASLNGNADTTLTLNGHGFGLTATLIFDKGNDVSGTALANTKTSGFCAGTFSMHDDEEGLILIVSFPNDESDGRYCRGNETTMVIKSHKIDALARGQEVSVRYKAAIQLLMDFKGTLTLITSP